MANDTWTVTHHPSNGKSSYVSHHTDPATAREAAKSHSEGRTGNTYVRDDSSQNDVGVYRDGTCQDD